MDLTVWRYMPLSKFISLLTYGALWFSKLNILQDNYEGMMPHPTKRMIESKYNEMKNHFPPNLHWQFDTIASQNEQDTRELLVVSCWFLDESESERMWEEYGGNSDAVAIKSTIGRLCGGSIAVPEDKHRTHIGRVTYVDFNNHLMTEYDANQGYERAFLKDNKYQHESEIRIVTLNVNSKYCIRPDGKPYEEGEINMSNFERPGLYIAVHIPQLISEIVISPTAGEWLYLLINRIMEINKLNIPVSYSKLAQG
jgi:hypothetical protein